MPGPGRSSGGDKREPDSLLEDAKATITVGSREPRAVLGVPRNYGNTEEAGDPDRRGQRSSPGKVSPKLTSEEEQRLEKEYKFTWKGENVTSRQR